MNKSDLIARMTERLGGDRATAVTAVNGLLEEIEGSVARGERVSLTGFGTFERRERAARTGRNPRTGETIQVGPSVVPVFRAGTGFRTRLGQDGAVSALGAAVDGAPTGEEVAQAAPAGPEAAVDAEAAAGRKKAAKKAKSEGGKKDGKAAKGKAGKKAAKAAR